MFSPDWDETIEKHTMGRPALAFAYSTGLTIIDRLGINWSKDLVTEVQFAIYHALCVS